MQRDEPLALLSKGAAKIISEGELREKLALGRPLRVKLGVDPTTADIHLGHTVVLRKLRQFQDLGHQAVLIIGDFTGMIGDPSGRSVTRPHLTHKEVTLNAQTYREQAFKILDPARTETVCNGDWFRAMSYEDVIRLNSRVTLQQMLQREDFRGRIDNQQPIPGKREQVLEFTAGRYLLRPDPRDRIPAVAVRQHAAPLLQRRRHAERRQAAHGALFDHRGRRLCRLRSGRRMVRDRT